jgi:DNA-binding PadR family transcriptional regulator
MQKLKILKNLRKRTIKNFLDIFILGQIQKKPRSGYDLIGLIHRRFDILISPGTIYSLLYSLERNALIKGIYEDERKRVYELTENGEKAIQAIKKANNEIQICLKNILIST